MTSKDQRTSDRAALINSARTARGGYTREQLADWGVSWPPPKSWKAVLIASDVELTIRQSQQTTFDSDSE